LEFAAPRLSDDLKIIKEKHLVTPSRSSHDLFPEKINVNMLSLSPSTLVNPPSCVGLAQFEKIESPGL
jgi:hypothetical protein